LPWFVSHEPGQQEVKRIFGNLGSSHNFDFSDEQLNAIIAYLEKYAG
jgi:hypothetical protein